MKLQIKEFAEYTHVSVRTLHYYDEIGLLPPAIVDSVNGYRYYDESSLFRMQEILFYRELDFSLKSIAEILSAANYDKNKALQEQKRLLILKKERLERMINAIDDAMKGENIMGVFDKTEFEKNKAEAKERWGATESYKQFEEKTGSYSKERFHQLAEEMDAIFAHFADCMQKNLADSAEAQSLVKTLQKHISENYYLCTNEILFGLAQMYVTDERFRKNIDKHADGTADFVCEAVKLYCKK